MNSVFYDANKICEIKELFDKAEVLAKEVEQFNEEASIAAINQLRYAGQHLLKALTVDNEKDFYDETLKAKGHCQRSMYEGSESGIAYAQEMIHEFQLDYSDVVIGDVIPDYAEMMVQADEASAILEGGRANRESAESQAESYMKAFRMLRKIVRKLQASRSDLNVKKDDLRKSDRRYAFGIVLTIVIATATILARCWRDLL